MIETIIIAAACVMVGGIIGVVTIRGGISDL